MKFNKVSMLLGFKYTKHKILRQSTHNFVLFHFYHCKIVSVSTTFLLAFYYLVDTLNIMSNLIDLR